MSNPIFNVGGTVVHHEKPDLDRMDRTCLYQALIQPVSDIFETARRIAIEVAERTAGFKVEAICMEWYEHPDSEVVYGAWVVFDTKRTRSAFQQSIGMMPAKEDSRA